MSLSIFRLSGRLGNGKSENKARGLRVGAREKRNESATPIFQFPRFRSLSPFSRNFSTEGASEEKRTQNIPEKAEKVNNKTTGYSRHSNRFKKIHPLYNIL